MITKEKELAKLKEKYEHALRNEPAVALAYSLFRVGEFTEVQFLQCAIVALVEIQEKLRKQVLNNPPPVVIFKNEPPVSAEQVQIMEAMKDQLVQSIGIPVSLMTADGCNYSGSKVAQEMFQKQLGVEPNEDQFR